MSTIELSAGWVLGTSGMMKRLFQSPTLSSSEGYQYGASRASLLNPGKGYALTGMVGFQLMKGTVPTNFSTLTSLGARSADRLWMATPGTSVLGDFITSQVTVNPAIISTAYVAATATGTATWFWWAVVSTEGSGATTHSQTAMPYQQIIGTVGTTGSGADLEIPSTSIVSGEPYRVMNLRLQMPTVWTY